MLKLPDTETAQIAESIAQVKQQLSYCDICGTITDTNPCYICTSPRRDRQVICVVEESDDLWAIERTNGYKGLYHVLGGVLFTTGRKLVPTNSESTLSFNEFGTLL